MNTKLLILLLLSLLITSLFTGCGCKPQVKYVYIKQKCPTLNTLDIKDLNLSKNKELKLHIKIKKKGDE